MLKRAQLLDIPYPFLMTPVMRGLIKYESLKDGSVDLADLFIMNHALRISDENERRIHETIRETNGS